jgi:hypothetical protein
VAGAASAALPEGDPSGWRVGQLKRMLAEAGVDCSHCIEKVQLVELCRDLLVGSGPGAAAAAPATTGQARAASSSSVASGQTNGSGGAAAAGKSCAKCGAERRPDGGKLRVCTGCLRAHYCSSECQKGHWREHKAVCKK